MLERRSSSGSDRGEHASGSRHDRGVSEAVSEAVEAVVRADSSAGADDGIFEAGEDQSGWEQGQANASKHSALSWGHATELEEELKAEVARLMELAAAADAEVPEGIDIPAELKRREDRLKAIAEAKAKIEARAAERHAAEQAE